MIPLNKVNHIYRRLYLKVTGDYKNGLREQTNIGTYYAVSSLLKYTLSYGKKKPIYKQLNLFTYEN